MADANFVALSTDRLIVRRFRAEDAASFAAYRSDPDVARHQSWTPPFSLTQARQFIAEMDATHPDTPGSWFQFAIQSAASGQHIGDVAAFVDGEDPRLATVGVTVAAAAQGRGYATEALTALFDYLFFQRGKHRLAADCDVRNTASTALLERLGMRREAHHLASTWAKGEWTDEYVYAILGHEWSSRRRSAGHPQQP